MPKHLFAFFKTQTENRVNILVLHPSSFKIFCYIYPPHLLSLSCVSLSLCLSVCLFLPLCVCVYACMSPGACVDVREQLKGARSPTMCIPRLESKPSGLVSSTLHFAHPAFSPWHLFFVSPCSALY